jgi:hypothetical protein
VLAGGERAPIQGFSLTVDAIVKVSPEHINTVVGIYSYLARVTCARTSPRPATSTCAAPRATS